MPGWTVSLGNDPAGRDGGRGCVDWEFVGVPTDGELGDVGADIIGVHALAEISGAEGGVEIKGDSAIGDLDSAEDVDVDR